jgi:Protein of unknown function (DUF3429)
VVVSTKVLEAQTMAINRDNVRHLPDEKEPPEDHTLRGSSLRRALSGDLPRTLTPHEWEQWYAEHGVPRSHIAPPAKQATSSRDSKCRAHSPQDELTAYVTWLGRAGLLPFLGLPVLMYLDAQHQQLWVNSLASYTLAIVCFLVGAWWGLALIRRTPMALLMSNTIVLVAFFSHVLLPTGLFLWLGAALLLTTVAIERHCAPFHRQPSYYARLRLQLSVVASASLVFTAAQL